MFRLSEKGRGVREMFDAIAPRYDLLNRLLSLGVDRSWRRFAVSRLKVPAGGSVLDVATGTGDLALEIASRTDASIRIVGEDLTGAMLSIAQKKFAASKWASRFSLVTAPCEALPHPAASFDAITIAFGIRNVVDREEGLREMVRVLRPNSQAVILEFSNPRNRLFKSIYNFYFLKVLPRVGGMLSSRSAYQYLPDSVLEFPDQETFSSMMLRAGFERVECHDLTFGVATVYVGVTPAA